MSGIANLEIDRGQTFSHVFSDAETDYALTGGVSPPIDITGYQCRLQAKTQTGAAGVLVFEQNSTASPTWLPLDVETNTLSLEIDWADTQDLPEGTFPYEIELITLADVRSIITTGTVEVISGVIF